MSNLNTPRLVPVGKLTEADIDRLLAEQRADMAARPAPEERQSVAAARALLHAAATAESVHGIRVTPFHRVRRERAAIPRRRADVLQPMLNVLLILTGFVMAHWRYWLPALCAIGLSGWWLFR